MPAGDVYRLNVFGVSLAQQVMNTLSVQTLPATDPDTTAQLALANGFKNVFQPLQHNSTLWTRYELKQQWGDGMDIDTPKCTRIGGRAFAGNLTAPLQGGQALNQPLPPQSALVITLSTGTIGRRKRGRLYIFGLGEQDQSGGTWDSAFITSLTTAWNTFFNIYKSGGTSPAYQLGVWSERTATGCVPNPDGRGHRPVDNPNPDQAFTPVTAYQIRTVVYTQRRRTLGVGR